DAARVPASRREHAATSVATSRAVIENRIRAPMGRRKHAQRHSSHGVCAASCMLFASFDCEEVQMKNVTMSPPTLIFLVATRAALAAGVGMFVAGKIPESKRRAVAGTLVALGALSTIPAALSLRRQNRMAPVA